ncbi:MAG: NAD-dependent epimerase/dehydratase family protein [Candidatus Altiarchaeia archaeon]
MTKPAQERIRKDCKEATQDTAPLLANLKNETILVTGGTGFMGTWLTEVLAYLNDNQGFNTKIILLSQNAYNFSLKAPHLATRKDVSLIEKDVRNLMEIPEEVSYIIHAAANPDNRLHSSDPIKVMSVISKGTESVLSAATRLPNIKKMLNISSGLIYGPQPLELEKMSEEYRGVSDCSSITSIYPEAKRYGESLCTAYRSQFKLPIVTARPFAFIGPYQLLDKPWAINNFIRDSLIGGPIRILGDKETVRSYMYASDMAVWILRILANGKPGLTYNVGSPHAITLKELAEKIAQNYPSPPKIVSDEQTRGGAKRSRFIPDTSLGEKTLGLTQKVDIDEAIRCTIMWNKSFYGDQAIH